MKVVYLAGPYTASTQEEVQANVQAAIDVQGELMRSGFAVFCPHANYGHAQANVSYQDVMNMCFAHLDVADLIVMMPGWERSTGSCQEIGFAIAKGKPVFYWPADTDGIMKWGEAL